MLSAPALFLNSLAVGALRGFLDTQTPLYVVLATFLIDYRQDKEVCFPLVW